MAFRGFGAALLTCLFFAGGHALATDLLPIVNSKVKAPSSAPAPSLLSPAPIASDPKWAVTLLVGASAGEDKLVHLLSAPWTAEFRDDYFAGAALSRRLVRFWDHFSVEAEIGIGGRFGVTDGVEGWGALFLRYDGFPWNKWIYTTVAISTGLNYVSRLPPAETVDPNDPTSHLLHYLAPEITFALPEYKQHEVLVRYHHRSGVLGTFNGVWGGSNVITVGYRNRFEPL